MVREAARPLDPLEGWLDLAEEDLALARHLVEEKTPFHKAVLSHARAAVEGFLRAFLIRHGMEAPAGLAGMLDRVALIDSSLARSLEPLAPLALFAGSEGVCGWFPAVSAKDSWQALNLAEFARESIRDALCACC